MLYENKRRSESRIFFQRIKMFSTPILLHVSQAETFTRSARRQTPNGLTAIVVFALANTHTHTNTQ